MLPPASPWYECLLDFLAGLLTRRQLGQAGAAPDMPSVAVAIPLPAFSAPVGPPVGLQESRDLAHCHPELTRRYLALKADFERETGRQLFETSTWRSQARQQELYQIGRRGIPGEKSVTKLDGVTKRSRHMVFPSEAVDCCVDSDPGPGKHPIWDEAAYAPLAPLALRHGLEWGGAWARLPDPPHLQLPAEAA